MVGCAPPSDAELQTIADGIGGLREEMSQLCFGPPGPQRTQPSTSRVTSGDGGIVTTTATTTTDTPEPLKLTFPAASTNRPSSTPTSERPGSDSPKPKKDTLPIVTENSSGNGDFQGYLKPELMFDKNVGELSHPGRAEGSSNSSVSSRADWGRVMVTSGSSSRQKDLSLGRCAMYMYCVAAMFMLPTFHSLC